MKAQTICALILVAAALASAESSRETIFPESYPAFWESAPYYSMACAESLPLLNLEEALPMTDYEEAQLAGTQGFGDALSHSKKARQELSEAKTSSTLSLYGLARIPLYEDYFYASIAAGSLGAPAPFLSVPAACFYSFVEAPNLCREIKLAACEGMTHSAAALSHASYAAEEARAAALAQAEELDGLGAGCPGYFGPEKATLLNARRALDENNPSSKTAQASALSWSVHDSFSNRATSAAGDGSFAKAFNSLAGSGGIVTESIQLASSLRNAKESMLASLASSRTQLSAKRSELASEISRLKEEGFHKIDSRTLSSFGSTAESARGALPALAPSEAIRSAENAVLRADYLAFAAGNTSRIEGRRCRVSEAVTNFDEAIRIADEALISLAESESETETALASAEYSVQEKILEAREKANSFNATSPGAAGLKARALSGLEKADRTLSSARFAEAGTKATAIEEASLLAETATAILSQENSTRAMLSASANSSLLSLISLAQAAESDGMDSALEKEFASEASRSLEFATPEDLAQTRLRASQLSEGIHEKAKARYRHLETRFLACYSGLASATNYATVSGSPSRVKEAAASLEELRRDYFSGEEIDSRLALGHYREIEETISSAETVFAGEKDSLISSAMESLARASCGMQGTPKLDEPSIETARFTLQNPYPFPSSGAIRVTFPNACKFESASFQGEGFTLISSTETEITAILESASPRSNYPAKLLSAPRLLARAEAEGSETLFITQAELAGRKEITLHSAKPLDSLEVFFPMQETPSTFSASATASAVRSSVAAESGISVTLERVPAGTSTAAITYSIASPFAINARNHSTTKISNHTFTSCFEAVVTARIGLPGFNASATLENTQASEAAPKVFSDGEEYASAASQRGSATAISWWIAGMQAGETRPYTICHTFENAPEHAQALLATAGEKLASLKTTGLLLSSELSEIEDGIETASGLIAQNKSTRAVEELEGTLATLSGLESLAASRLQAKAATEDASREFLRARSESDSLHSALEEAGFDEESSLLRSQISRADAFSSEAASLSSSGLFPEAKAKFAQAAQALDVDGMEEKLSARAANAMSSLLLAQHDSAAAEFFSPQNNSDELAEALLASADEKVGSGDIPGGVRELARAESLITSASLSANASLSGAKSALDASAAVFKRTAPKALAAWQEFEASTTISEGLTAPSGSSIRGLQANGTPTGFGETLSSLSTFFTEYSSAQNKKGFISENAEGAKKALSDAGEVNQTTALLQNSSSRYKSLAESLIEDASLKQGQAEALASGEPSLEKSLADANATLSRAKTAFSEGRHADAIILAEKAITDASRIVYAQSQAIAARGSQGFTLEPVHLAIPALLASFAYAYFKGKEKPKAELKKLPKPPLPP